MLEVIGDKYIYLIYCVHLVGIKEVINHYGVKGYYVGPNKLRNTHSPPAL
jgi:hypothetical protein